MTLISFIKATIYSKIHLLKNQKMKTIKTFGLFVFLISLLITFAIPFQSCKPDDDDQKEEECDSCIIVFKPNIYLYPNEKTRLSVNLDFPKGGKVVTSVPEYGNGWKVTADKNGWIDDTYLYLFYESSQPDVWQQNEGWLVAKNQLKTFFTENLTDYGFAGREIQDFTDYWIPRLTTSEYYTIYPQTQDLIKTVIDLNCSPEPDNLMRLFYLIQEAGDNPENEPATPQTDHTFVRKGFFITEWGVILK